ncbi:MAG: beta-ketoacyl-[acyl-carrier-protein] synthase family protein [bacterium]
MKRVAVTGMGVVTPLGNTLESFRQGLLEGRSGVSGITHFTPGTLPSRIAGQCTLPQYRFKDRKIDFATAATRSAVDQANHSGISLQQYYQPADRGISMGIGLELFNLTDLVKFACDKDRDKRIRTDNIEFLQTPGDLCVKEMAKVFASGIPAAIHISACAASTDSIGDAFLSIARGQARMMLTGGTDSMINPLGVGGFCKLNALSTRNDEPHKASRPFDRGRDGFVLGEGAAVLVLENLDDAVHRGATILAEVMGYGNALDAYSISEPDPQGRGAAMAMRQALATAGLSCADISYINAHGTSTPKNDPAETRAIKTVFGDRAFKIPVSSTKSMIGHLISAAGAVEAVASILCANSGMVHPTINQDHPDQECDLDYVANKAKNADVKYFMSNSFAFGGMNSSLVFRAGAAV